MTNRSPESRCQHPPGRQDEAAHGTRNGPLTDKDLVGPSAFHTELTSSGSTPNPKVELIPGEDQGSVTQRSCAAAGDHATSRASGHRPAETAQGCAVSPARQERMRHAGGLGRGASVQSNHDAASKELADLRRQLGHKQGALAAERSRAEAMLASAKSSTHLPPLALRTPRLVTPPHCLGDNLDRPEPRWSRPGRLESAETKPRPSPRPPSHSRVATAATAATSSSKRPLTRTPRKPRLAEEAATSERDAEALASGADAGTASALAAAAAAAAAAAEAHTWAAKSVNVYYEKLKGGFCTQQGVWVLHTETTDQFSILSAVWRQLDPPPLLPLQDAQLNGARSNAPVSTRLDLECPSNFFLLVKRQNHRPPTGPEAGGWRGGSVEKARNRRAAVLMHQAELRSMAMDVEKQAWMHSGA